tara:strand:+ start:187 stop:894 length:708 start_codon:yes stop_codon:yes gene_type:complete
MKNFNQDISSKLVKIDRLPFIYDEETSLLIYQLSKKIKSIGSERTLDKIIDDAFQGYASQLCIGEALKKFGNVDQPNVKNTYDEWALHEKKYGDYKFFNGKKLQIKSIRSYEKDISMSFDKEYKYNDLVATCDKDNPKYSEHILITRCVPLINRKKYLVSASALLSTFNLLRYVKKYGKLYHLQTGNLYRRGMLEWYDKYSGPCDEDGNYHADMGVIIKRYIPPERPIDLESRFG